MMGVHSTRIDDEVSERLERFCEREGVTESSAIARFIEDGLAQDEAVSLRGLADRLEAVEGSVDQLDRNVNAVYNRVRKLGDQG